MQEEKKEKLVYPVTGEEVDEQITETEAKKRGYMTLEFMMKHLEDRNESFKLFVIEGKKVLVHAKDPILDYKKRKMNLDYERVLHIPEGQDPTEKKKAQEQAKKFPVLPVPGDSNTCSLDDPTCLSCGS